MESNNANHYSNKNKADESQETKGTAAQLVIDSILSSDAVLFHDQYKRAYISPHGHGGEILRLNSEEFSSWIYKSYWEKRKKPLPRDADRQIVQVLTALARFDGPLHHLEIRLAREDDELWYDLADGSAIRVTDKTWEVVQNPPILFRRVQQLAQVQPERGQIVEHLLNYVNIDDEEEKLLFLVFVVSAFIPGFPHPLLILHGSQGAGKTTPMRVIKELVDPSVIQGTPLPTHVAEFVQLADHHAFLFFDNLSNLPTRMSDALARAATGDSFSKRKLYADDDDVTYYIRKTMSLNGINQVITKPDLLDRSILIKMKRIAPEQRLPEKDFWAAFHNDKPQILGAIFDVLVKALALYPTIELSEVPRMADFTHWGCAIAEAAGYGQQAFIDAYKHNIDKQNDEAIEASPVAKAIILFMKGKYGWEGSPEELRSKLTKHKDVFDLGLTSSPLWPKAPEWMTRRLNDVQTNLNAIGIRVEIERTPDGRKIVLINDPDKVDTDEWNNEYDEGMSAESVNS